MTDSLGLSLRLLLSLTVVTILVAVVMSVCFPQGVFFRVLGQG